MTEYRVALDVADCPRFLGAMLRYWPGRDDREGQLIYAALEAGQWRLDGGYPCPAGGHRHQALTVERIDWYDGGPPILGMGSTRSILGP